MDTNCGPFGTVRLVSDGGLFGDFLLERCGPGTISPTSVSHSCSGMPSTSRDVDRFLPIGARCCWEDWADGNSAVPFARGHVVELKSVPAENVRGDNGGSIGVYAINVLFDEQIGDLGAKEDKQNKTRGSGHGSMQTGMNACHCTRHHIVHTDCTYLCLISTGCSYSVNSTPINFSNWVTLVLVFNTNNAHHLT